MNEIEQRFYDAFIGLEEEPSNIQNEFVIGPYRVDFLLYRDTVVEIDGHEAHKTKEQRSNDYTRERFIQTKGYTVVRFMGTEVYNNAKKCVEEAMAIDAIVDDKRFEYYDAGFESGKGKVKKK